MKTRIIILASLLILILGCEEKSSKVEVLKTHEFDYLTDDEVDSQVKFIDDADSKQLNSEFLEIGNRIKSKNTNFPEEIVFHIRFFVNENGKIDFIKSLKRPNPENKLLIDSFLKEISELFSKKNIIPAKKNGIDTKYRTDLKIGIENYSDSLRLFMPGFLENISKINLSKVNEKKYLIEVDAMPSPIGGMYEVQEKIKYPEIAKRAGIEGRVFVKAFIDEEGNVAGTEVMKGIGAGCDEAAIHAVENTKFKPGRQKGKAVKVQVTVPILFKLQ